MKLSTGIIVIVLLFTFMDVTNGTEYRMYDGHELGYGCHKGYCWTYCGASWVSFFLFYFSFIHQLTTIQYFKTSNISIKARFGLSIDSEKDWWKLHFKIVIYL